MRERGGQQAAIEQAQGRAHGKRHEQRDHDRTHAGQFEGGETGGLDRGGPGGQQDGAGDDLEVGKRGGLHGAMQRRNWGCSWAPGAVAECGIGG